MHYNITESQTDEVLKTLAKRRNTYTVVFIVCLAIGAVCGIIPVIGRYLTIAMFVLWGIFAGFGMLCINYYRYTKTNGAKQGGGLWWALLLIFGIIVIPCLTVVICNKIKPLASRILGVTFV